MTSRVRNIYKPGLSFDKMLNKRGAEMSVNTLILIVIGVLILVLLILGLTIGWNKIFPFINPPNNVKTLSDQCSYSCDTQARYDYCISKRDVKIESAITIQNTLDSSGNFVFGQTQGKFKASCSELSLLEGQLDIKACPGIQCDPATSVYSSLAFAKLSCQKMQNTAAVNLNYLDANGVQVQTPFSCPGKSLPSS